MIVPASAETIDRAARLLREGQLVSFPTETVYGLGADARNAAAVRRIFAAKKRPADHPLIVHIADASVLPRWARSIPPGARALADAFWPGPLTLILPRARDVGDIVTGGQDCVGLRVPGHPVAQALLAQFASLGGEGIAAPSANRFGRISATTAQHVADDFGEEIALILDGGPCRHGIESTIVAFTDGEASLLRPGALSVAELSRVLGRPLPPAALGSPRAPGTLATHYAPRPPDFEGTWFDAPAHDTAYAQQLYASLRALDALAADEIWIEAPPDGPEWHAVRDRLRRATERD
ncbi:MAG: threonylcarbamoyl-AMP synthase [Betaproteobacteria bacterium]|nr:MAG: threonylcarbamoyl-AMP synthase [Betaproteobacteria bacterium]